MKNTKSKKGIIFNWCFSIFCILTLWVYGFDIGSILTFLIGIISLPIKPLRKIWDTILGKVKWLRPIILGVLFVIAIGLIPQEKIDANNKIDIETTLNEETSETKTTEKNEISDTEEKSSEEVTTTQEETTEQEELTTQEIESKQEETTTQEVENEKEETTTQGQNLTENDVDLADIPSYSGQSYVTINNNNPYFTDEELGTTAYEFYSDLDSLGRCGVVYACIGKEIMPTEERGKIGMVKPSGWHTDKYDSVDGKYLYNRCHLIGYQLTGENANISNLITGTRSMNVDGMLPFENMVADYVSETGNHVMYRVTPMYEGNNLLASGVLMEAKSVEDKGEGILFNVFVYNAQHGVEIDYKDGSSYLVEELTTETPTTKQEQTTQQQIIETTTAENNNTYVWISETGSKYHSINHCGRMNPNKAYQLALDVAISYGYTPCSKCY